MNYFHALENGLKDQVALSLYQISGGREEDTVTNTKHFGCAPWQAHMQMHSHTHTHKQNLCWP